MHPYLAATVGGLLIGLASWLLLLGLGRVAGISGIAAGAISPGATSRGERAWRWAFLLGLVLVGGLLQTVWLPSSSSPASNGRLVLAGLLVGVGTVLGSGCTSGHGVCGLGRLSFRSLVAVMTFMAAGALTVAILPTN